LPQQQQVDQNGPLKVLLVMVLLVLLALLLLLVRALQVVPPLVVALLL
jgi:hypothetical protein